MHATHDNMSIPNGNAGFRNKACTELTITELLADPLTGALMRADRVDMAGFHEMLRSVAMRLQTDAAQAKPMFKFTGEAKPYPPISLSGISASRDPESAAMRSTQAAAAAKAAKPSCGSHCPW
jgi:hypothetical protein